VSRQNWSYAHADHLKRRGQSLNVRTLDYFFNFNCTSSISIHYFRGFLFIVFGKNVIIDRKFIKRNKMLHEQLKFRYVLSTVCLNFFFWYILLLLFNGDFVQEGSYFYDVKDTIESK